MRFLKRAVPTHNQAAIAATATGVAALQLERSGGRPRVTGLAMHGDTHAIRADVVGRLTAEAGIDGTPLVALLGGEFYQTVVVDAPQVPADELNFAIRWKVKDFLNFSLEEAVLDYLPIPGHSGRGDSMYVVAAQSAAVRELAQPFHEAHLNLQAIDVMETAQHNLARLIAPPEQAIAVLHVEAGVGLLTFSHGEHLILSRRIDGRSLGGSYSGSVMDTVCMEVQRSVDYFERQFSWLPLGRLWLAPGGDAAHAARQLPDYLSLGISVMELGQVIDLNGHDALAETRMQSAVFHLLGAALREPERA